MPIMPPVSPTDVPTAAQLEGPVSMMTSASSGHTAAMRDKQRKRIEALRLLGRPRDVKGSHTGNSKSWALVFVRFSSDGGADDIAPAVLLGGCTALCSAEIPDSANVVDGGDMVDTAQMCWLKPVGKRWGQLADGVEEVPTSTIFPHRGRTLEGHAKLTGGGEMSACTTHVFAFLQRGQTAVNAKDRGAVIQAYRDHAQRPYVYHPGCRRPHAEQNLPKKPLAHTLQPS
jgi:hypothetical protein